MLCQLSRVYAMNGSLLMISESCLTAKGYQAHFVETSALLNENIENLSIILHADLTYQVETGAERSPSRSPKVPKSPLALKKTLSVKRRDRIPSMDEEATKKKKKENRLSNCFSRRRSSQSCEDIMMMLNSEKS